MDNQRGPDEIDAANRYHTHVRGWLDGSRAMMKRESHVTHPKYGQAYLEGYDAGMVARANAFGHASKRYGHAPSILRAGHPDDETSGTSDRTNEGEGQ